MRRLYQSAMTIAAPFLILLAIPFIVSCAAIFGEKYQPETPTEKLAAVEVLFAETIRTAIAWRSNQIELADNQALAGVDGGLITLVAGDRVSALIADARLDDRFLTLPDLDKLIAERDDLLEQYRGAGIGTTSTARVEQIFHDLEKTLDLARAAIGVGDILEADNLRGQAVDALRSLRDLLASKAAE